MAGHYNIYKRTRSSSDGGKEKTRERERERDVLPITRKIRSKERKLDQANMTGTRNTTLCRSIEF